MSINCYSGLQGSGKSYEVVSSIIVPAVAAGRRVVTNIRGIDSDAIRAYCVEVFDIQLDKCGSVVSVTDDDVRSADFFPTEKTHEDREAKCLVLPGDLVAVDEAYKIWGSDCKIPNEHRVFFREHRHYQHPVTKVTCDMVLMTQDIGDIHRFVKVVLETTFKTHKAKGVGLNNTYTITMWEGYKQTAKTIVKDWTQNYRPEFFPLYKSYAGDGDGKETATDKRQNILADKRFLWKVGIFILVLCFIGYRLFHYWWAKVHPEDALKPGVVSTASGASPGVAGAAVMAPAFSPEWRISGVALIGGQRLIMLTGGTFSRLDDAMMYTGDGLRQVGSVDGQKVTRYSGHPVGQAQQQAGILK